MTITYEAIEFETASEAIQHTDASRRGVAIRVRGQAMVVDESDARRLEVAGIEFAYLHDHEMPGGEE